MNNPANGSCDSFEYVDRDEQLIALCDELKSASSLGFDSEFIRTNTFFPKPGLFQVRAGSKTTLIDPISISKWRPLVDVLESQCTFVMHSCSEDLGLLQYFLKTRPGSLFDTQRAAAFLDLGYSLSYQALVKDLLGFELPKGETRSDWLQRPLDSAQITYAALDVEYLPELRDLLAARLASRGYLEWFEQDCQALLTENEQDGPALWELAYSSIGGAWQLSVERLVLLQRLAFWREKSARERDRPKNWVAKDAELLQLAVRLPEQEMLSLDDLYDANVFSSKFVARHGQALVNFMNDPPEFAAMADPVATSKPLSGRARKTLKALQTMSAQKAAQLQIAPELLSRKRLWQELLEGFINRQSLQWPTGLDNWRRQVLKQDVESILSD